VEGGHRVETTVETEGEFVEVELQVPRANAVMCATQPSIEVREHQMDNRQVLFGHGRIAALRDSCVRIALAESSVADPVVGDDPRAWFDAALDESTQGLHAAVRQQRQAHASSVTVVTPLAASARLVALTDLDATPFAACAPANIGLVGLDMNVRAGADAILVGAHHAGAQLVQDLEGGFIARQSQLALELYRRHTGCLGRHQVSAPEPYRKRGMRALHDGFRSK
jgi:hypothetical protein